MEISGGYMGRGAAEIEGPWGHSRTVLRDNCLGGSGDCEGSVFYSPKKL